MRRILIALLLIAVAGASQAGVRKRAALPTMDATASAPCFDPNNDGEIDSADFFYLINYVYEDGPPPVGNGDANGDGEVDFADIVYLYNFLFLGGPAPVC